MAEIYIDFEIFSYNKNADFSQVVDFPPTKQHRIGDLWHKKIILDNSGWSYEITSVNTNKINELAKLFYNKFSPFKQKMEEFLHLYGKQSEFDLYFVIRKTDDEIINYDIEERFTKYFNELNISIRFD